MCGRRSRRSWKSSVSRFRRRGSVLSSVFFRSRQALSRSRRDWTSCTTLDLSLGRAPIALLQEAAEVEVSRLLVPTLQVGSLIGKQGTIVKSILESSNCIVKVLGAEDLPVFALQDDRVVEVAGEAAGVHKALELIASHLGKFLADRSIIPLFEMHMQMSTH